MGQADAYPEVVRSGLRRVVFWDFDGTLAVRDGMWSGAVIDALRSVDPDTALDAAQVRPYLGEGFPWHTPKIVDAPPLSATAWSRRLVPVFARALTKNGIPEDLATAASARVLTEYYRVDPWSLIAGAADALQLTRAAGYDNVILSNHGPGLPALVEALGLDRLVDRTITSAAAGIEKPNPLLFEHALRVAEAGSDTWMIGDNPVADVQGAEAVGIRALLADGIYPDSRGMTVLQSAQVAVKG